MSSFTTELKIDYIDGKTWRVAEEFSYCVGAKDSGWLLTVPKGSATDFASIPSIIKGLIPTSWKYSKASVLHDYLYRSGNKSKAISDAIFLEAMLASGLNKFGAYAMFFAVSIFGSKAYKAGIHYS